MILSEPAVLSRIVSRREWDRLLGWRATPSGSRIEHLMHGPYVPRFPFGAGVKGGGL